MKTLKGSFKFDQMHVGELSSDAATDADGALTWDPRLTVTLSIGDELIVVDAAWVGDLQSGVEISVARPRLDATSSPKPDCEPDSYDLDPDKHRWCCRSHERAEAEWSDEIAARRERGELNPQTWPPIVDADQFDVTATGLPTNTDTEVGDGASPSDALTIDDLD